MNEEDWQRELAGQLVANGLPLSYVKRVVRELDDHRADISDERGESSSATYIRRRLGDPTLLARSTTASYRGRSFLGRHPWLTFMVLPIPLSVIVTLVCVLGAVYIYLPVAGMCLGIDGEIFRAAPSSPAERLVLLTMFHGVRFLPSLAVVAVLGWAGTRLGHSHWWLFVSLALVTAFFALQTHDLQISNGNGPSEYRLGLADVSLTTSHVYTQCLQGLLPLLAGGLFLWRLARLRRDSRLFDDQILTSSL